MKKNSQVMIPITALALAVGMSAHSPAFAAGFENQALSVSALGTANAGASVQAEDASNQFYNPATLSDISQPVLTVAGNFVIPNRTFENEATSSGLGQPISGQGNLSGEAVIVPSVYFAMPINQQLAVGVSLNAPFASATKYDENWVGRYHSIESNISTYNLNPALSYKVTNNLALGAGVSLQVVDAELVQAINSQTVCFGGAFEAALLAGADPATAQAAAASQCAPFAAVPTASQKLSGDSTAYGWNIGLLYDISPAVKVGFDYRSEISHTLEGNADFIDVNPALSASGSLLDASASLGLTFPQSASLAVLADIGSGTELMFDASWIGWSSFDQIVIDYDSAQSDTVLPQEWDDAWRLAAGAQHQYNDAMLFRAGVAYDQSPITGSEFLSPRIPGGDRTWISLGMNYKFSEMFDMDLGYTHVFIDNSKTTNVSSSGDVLVGEFTGDADVLGLQLNARF